LPDFASFVALGAVQGVLKDAATGERRMDATLSSETTAHAQKQATKDYKSRPGALKWFFEKSRDRWKSKYQELQKLVKQLKNRVADVTKSREQWKLKAEQAKDQLAVLETEIATLRAGGSTGKKTTKTAIS
jgi:uncharacterized protein YlxW (UPF0749 family)